MDEGMEWWRWALLILIFGGLFVAWFWVNRNHLTLKNLSQLGKSEERKVRILERSYVSHQLTIFLVEVDGARFLLARNPGSLAWQPLSSRTDTDNVASKEHG